MIQHSLLLLPLLFYSNLTFQANSLFAFLLSSIFLFYCSILFDFSRDSSRNHASFLVSLSFVAPGGTSPPISQNSRHCSKVSFGLLIFRWICLFISGKKCAWKLKLSLCVWVVIYMKKQSNNGR